MVKRSQAKGSKDNDLALTRLQVRLEHADYKALLAACKLKRNNTDASTLIRSWANYLLKPPGTARKITGMAAPETFKDDPRALVFDARLHVTMDASILKALRDACRSQGISHSSVVRGLVEKILKLHRQGKKSLLPRIQTRRK